MMTNRERFTAALNGKPADRLPVIEWASWWDQTYLQWQHQGMNAELDVHKINVYFGLDDLVQLWVNHRMPEFPVPKKFLLYKSPALNSEDRGFFAKK